MNGRKGRTGHMKTTDKDIQMLGSQVVLEGNLVFEGTLYMNGHVKGAIESRKGSIVIGEEAVIHADVFVQSATIKGEVKGTVRATERIALHPPARVYGDLAAPAVQVDPGVIIEGNCAIRPKEKAAPQVEKMPSAKVEKDSKTDEIPAEAKDALGLGKK